MSETELATKKSLHIVVVVLGDLGRSPRMQYHANSLLHDDLMPELKQATLASWQDGDSKNCCHGLARGLWTNITSMSFGREDIA